MRIHANYLTLTDIYRAVANLPGVSVTASLHGSRSHRAAFEVSLEGHGYRKNSGVFGASEENGATWDEWGVFIAAIYAVDAQAVFGSVKHPTYKNSWHFSEVTGGRFNALTLPEDTHKRHVWEGMRGMFTCKKCSATLN